VLDDMLRDRVALVKKDGTVFREEIPCIVTKGKVQIHDATLPVQIDDHLLRNLPNGLVEDYIVKDPVLHSGFEQGFFIVDVRRSDAPSAPKQATIGAITNHFHGDHSRVNIHSTDLSTNVSGRIDVEKLQALLTQIRPVIGALPLPQQQTILEPLTILEDEIRDGNPSPLKITAALASIRTIAEGAAGNLVASGIVALVSLMMAQ